MNEEGTAVEQRRIRLEAHRGMRHHKDHILKADGQAVRRLGRGCHYIRPVDKLNSDTFIEFLKYIREKSVVIMDNMAYHKSNKMDRSIESAGGDVIPAFLLPYTPQLNPIGIQ